MKWQIVIFFSMFLLSNIAYSLSLDECIQIALLKNESVLIANVNVEISNDAIKSAKSERFPQINLSSIYRNANHPPQIKFGGSALDLGEKEWYSVGAEISIPIYTSGMIKNNIQSENFKKKINDLILSIKKRELIYTVTENYFNVLRIEKLHNVAQKALKSANAHHKQVKDFYEQGITGKNNLLEVMVTVKNNEQLLLKLENALSITKSVLNDTLTRNPSDELTIKKDYKIVNLKKNNAELLEIALKNREEIIQLNLQEKILKYQLKIIKATIKPQVFFQTKYDYRNDDFLPEKDEYFYMMIAKYKIFDGAKTKHVANQIKKEINKIDLRIKEVNRAIILQVKNSYLALLNIKKNIDVANSTVEYAKENLKIVEDKYSEKVVDITKVNDAETRLTQAETQYYNNIYNYLIEYAKLENLIAERINGT